MRLFPLLLVSMLASAQGVQQLVARGQEIYAKSCATGYYCETIYFLKM